MKLALGRKYMKERRSSDWRGVYVQVPGFPGRVFSRSKHSSWAACRLAARARRDALARRMKPFPPRAQKRPSRRSRLQIIGVSPYRGRRNRRFAGYRAQMVRAVGRWRRVARFALSKHGGLALALAASARRRFEVEWEESPLAVAAS